MAEKAKFKTAVGGQAVLEGVMMRGREKYCVAVRNGAGEIVTKIEDVKPAKPWQKLPVIRGCLSFISSLITGYSTLMYSASIAGIEEEEPSKFETWLMARLGDKAGEALNIFAAVLGALLALVLFMVLPTAITGLVDGFVPLGGLKAPIEGVLKLIVFLCYVALCSRMKEIYRLFCYHGAEHKSIACYEAGLELTVENVRAQTRFHPRCGTSFMLIVMLVSIALFSFLPWTSTLIRVLLKVLLLPLVMGIAYEIIQYSGRNTNLLSRVLAAPGMWLQRLTTHEPSDDMIEVAIAAITPVLPPAGEQW